MERVYSIHPEKKVFSNSSHWHFFCDLHKKLPKNWNYILKPDHPEHGIYADIIFDNDSAAYFLFFCNKLNEASRIKENINELVYFRQQMSYKRK